MKAWKKIIGCATVCAATGAFGLASPPVAHAQNATNSRFFVELKDATLYDALEMLFKAGGNDPRSIDAAAKEVKIGSFVRNNIDWYSAALQLSNDYDYRVYRDQARTVHVEPRAPAVTEGGAGGFGVGAMPGAGVRPGTKPGAGTMPRNPFGGTTARPLIQPTSWEGDEANANVEANIVIQSNAQTAPAFGRNTTTAAAGGAAKNPNARFRIVPVKHVYVGGIAKLFNANVGIISTEQFVVPESSGNGSVGGGNNSNGRGNSFSNNNRGSGSGGNNNTGGNNSFGGGNTGGFGGGGGIGGGGFGNRFGGNNGLGVIGGGIGVIGSLGNF